MITNTSIMIEEKWPERLIDNVVGKIRENKIVPIIGPEAFYVKDGEKTYSIQEYVTELILNDPVYSVTDEEKNIVCLYRKGYRGMSELNKLLKGGIQGALFNAYNNTKNKAILREEVKEFLEYGDFPLIITTCNFDFLSDRIQYKGNRYNIVAYRKQCDTDINIETEGPTIFHLFGHIGCGDDPVVITEDDFLAFLHHLNNDEYRPLRCKRYLEYKNILSIGCDIPDWTFRFLLYSLKEQNGEFPKAHDNLTFDGGVVVEDIDDDLTSFLSDLSYCFESFSDSKVISFLEAINRKITPIDKPKIFLSICSKEYDTGYEIKSKLTDIYEVWIFDENRDMQYWKKIETAIEECDFFMPVITEKAYRTLDGTDISQNVEDSKDNAKGLVTEWQLALKIKQQNRNGEKYCVPFVVGKTQEERDELMADFKDKLKEKDPYKNVLWPLFFPKEGAEAYTSSSVSELTAEKIKKHIKDTENNYE